MKRIIPVLGLVCATWASSIDDMKLLLGLNEAEQGWLLFSGPIGNLVSFTFASALVTRIGSRRSLMLATCVYFASALGIAACFICRAPVPLWCVAIASLGGTGNGFGRYYEQCRARGMRHNKALKAVARKRLGVIYAIMRDRVPYVEPASPVENSGQARPAEPQSPAAVENSVKIPLTKL